MAIAKPRLVLVAEGKPDRVFREVARATPVPIPAARSPMGLDTEFLQRTGRAAGAIALARAATLGLAVVGIRDGQPVVRDADGSERVTTWAELDISPES